jgi:hypothetical protein
MNNITQERIFMHQSEIVDVTETFKEYSKLHTNQVNGIFFLWKKGLKKEDSIQLRDNHEYDLKDVIQITWVKRGKSIPIFYYQLSLVSDSKVQNSTEKTSTDDSETIV